MLSCTLFILFSSFVSVTAHQPTPSTPPTTPLAGCQYNGKIYFPGDNIPTSDNCEQCRCELDYDGDARKTCMYADYFTPMCYNPVENGHNACYRFTCPERNCMTPSGHVLVGNQHHYFNDDGLCRCREQPQFLPGDQWKPENGVAICHQPTTVMMPIG